MSSSASISPQVAFLTGFHYASQAAMASSCLCIILAPGPTPPGLFFTLSCRFTSSCLGNRPILDILQTLQKSKGWERNPLSPSLNFLSSQSPTLPAGKLRVSLSKSLPGKPVLGSLCLFPVTTGEPTFINDLMTDLRQLPQILPLQRQYHKHALPHLVWFFVLFLNLCVPTHAHAYAF